MRDLGFRLAAVWMLFSLAGCASGGLDSETFAGGAGYSPNYTYVTIVREDGSSKRVLIPEACLAEGGRAATDSGPNQAPPGCANSYNLQRMVENKDDLIHGRRMSRAPAAPAARAAQQYIDDRAQHNGGATFPSNQPISVPASETQEQ